ncbi:hypothetical protein HO173_004399 [Letharia columbiana]|uniref:DUF4185 domain-containing protein n=1 Tax=Letharia columbiana TaxID=112416 RepID=A0A8H6FYW9_9LECA|nr:uncharacterized protein HO173_004399 [Letharia columbiana]KAF6237509.1 hypothetical protein HO173_004399 [Letharia columbiana]
MLASSDVPTEGLAALSAMPPENTITDNVTNASASSPGNNANDGPHTAADTQIEAGEPSITHKTGTDDPDHEADIGPAIYPPALENMEVLGYIKDKNGIDYFRDIGCSASIHDEVYFVFGDTFCKNSAGKSVGTTSNTIAYVEDRTNFLESEYREISNNARVKAFVPLNDREIRFEEKNENARVVFRMFGGIADIGVVGVIWFQKSIKYENGEESYRGVGQARLSTYSDGSIIVERLPPLLFGPNEPKIGSFSTLFYKGHVYLWGDGPKGQIMLARVDQYETALRDRYEYWSGSDWVQRWHDAVPVLHDVQHGAIIHTNLFGKEKPFVFVGVNNRADSMVQIGAAAEVQGPFALTAVCQATGIKNDKEHKCCIYPHIYPHLWASNVPKRELMITWSESPPGGVIAAKLKFKIDEVAAVKEAEERKRAAEEQETRRLASIAKEQEANFEYGFVSDESDDPRPRRDRSEGRLKTGYVLRVVRTSSDHPTKP